MMPPVEELYRSPNGDAWFLETTEGGLFVVHEPNASSGGRISRLAVEVFLQRNGRGPEVEALLRVLRKPSAPD
jgi:hypothetical protein